MPTWKPSRLRSWLFSGSGWIFNSDGDAFELSLDRGRRVVKGPLILIHSLECKPRHNFSTTLECHFHIIGTGWVVGEGLGEDKAEELQQFVREEVTGSLAHYGSRAIKILDPWQRQVDQRLEAVNEVDPALLEQLKATIPSPAAIGLPTWGAPVSYTHLRAHET